MVEEVREEDNEALTNEEIMKLAKAMEQNAPVQDEKQNVHTFLHSVVISEDTRKIGNLRDDDKLSELGLPAHTVRGSFEMARISGSIMDNPFYQQWFLNEAEEALSTSLSRGGFLIRQATTTTKAVADATKRTKINKGMFGKKNIEVSGGDPYSEGGVEHV